MKMLKFLATILAVVLMTIQLANSLKIDDKMVELECPNFSYKIQSFNLTKSEIKLKSAPELQVYQIDYVCAGPGKVYFNKSIGTRIFTLKQEPKIFQ